MPGDAQAAQDDLNAAVRALQDGESEAGFARIETARGHVDGVTAATTSLGAKVWSWVPLAGSGVRDVRELGQALDQMTSALEIGAEVFPEVSGDDARLMGDQRIDLEVLGTVLASLEDIEGHLVTARAHLEDVKGSNLVVGDQTGAARDKAMGYVRPATDGLERMGPLLDELPNLLGKDGDKRYVIAMMNPSEMKYAGGSMLSFAPADVRDGQIELGEALDNSTGDSFLSREVPWDRLEDNPFAAEEDQRIIHANSAPAWPVAGEETMRAWEALFPEEQLDGMIAVDVLAMQSLMRVTGGFEVEGLGRVTADNVVRLTVGDYGKYQRDEQAQRKELNRQLVPSFADQLFSSNDLVGTVRAMTEAVNSRNLVFTFRDADAAAAAAKLRFDGDLSDTDHDYLGFFTQSRYGTKADYWQQKTVEHLVMLREDGSARVRSELSIANMGAVQEEWDLSAYTDPDLALAYGAFLPKGAGFRGQQAMRDDGGRHTFRAGQREFRERTFTTRNAQISSGKRSTMRLTYWVPSAASMSGEEMTYRLAIDNHPTVRPERVVVTVQWPEGYEAGSLPEGWELNDDGSVTLTVDELDGRASFSVGGRQS